ncbi:MAG TPA: DinB family protein [Chitinophagaceae bacterium]|nr:DinB family protein [Chitinophagaceae bacterium]
MNKELQSIIADIENTLDGQPWYGRPVYALLNDVDPEKAFIRPNAQSFCMAEILYHMLTWSQFTLKRIEKDKIEDLDAFEKIDWRELDPKFHSWEEALSEFIATHQQIIALLKTKDDSLLDETVDYRKYNFRFLLNGFVDHSVYHVGQIIYISKMLSS